MQTFNGQLKDFNEFLSLLNKAIENYKPKKLEQKDAFNKVIEVINNSLKNNNLLTVNIRILLNI